MRGVDVPDRIQDLLRGQVHHAFEVTEGALAPETGTAGEVELEYTRPGRERGRVRRAARAVESDERLAQGGGDVHQPRIVAHDEPRRGENVDRLGERGAAAQIARRARAGDL